MGRTKTRRARADQAGNDNTGTKRTDRKNAARLSLVKTRPDLPTRDGSYMTDIQPYAALACRLIGIHPLRITAWTDHRDGTATCPLKDGTLHYQHDTRTLHWQATCLMGAVHTYRIDSHAAAAAARVEAATCHELHADLTTIKPLTPDELEQLGLLQTPTWARPDLLGQDITDTIPIPDEPIHRATSSAADTQPMSQQAIAEGLAARTADTAKEHTQP